MTSFIPWQIEIISFSFFHYWWMIYFYGFHFHKIHSLSLKLKTLKIAICNWRDRNSLHVSCSVLSSELFSWKLLLTEYHEVQYGKNKRKHLKFIRKFTFPPTTKTVCNEPEDTQCGCIAPPSAAEGFYLCNELEALEERGFFCTADLCHNKQANVYFIHK